MPKNRISTGETIFNLKKELREAWLHLKDVQNRKNDALSEYDVSMGYDWYFYTNTDNGLLRNHVIYYIRELRKFMPGKTLMPEEFQLVDSTTNEQSNQISLF